MKRTAKWMNKLTISELKHLAEVSDNGRPTLAGLKRNRIYQLELKQIHNLPQDPCYECRTIARKLGLEQ